MRAVRTCLKGEAVGVVECARNAILPGLDCLRNGVRRRARVLSQERLDPLDEAFLLRLLVGLAPEARLAVKQQAPRLAVHGQLVVAVATLEKVEPRVAGVDELQAEHDFGTTNGGGAPEQVVNG